MNPYELKRLAYESRVRVAARACRDDADQRAEDLLLEHMTPQQRVEWETARSFTVNGSDGHRYTIRATREQWKQQVNEYYRKFPKTARNPWHRYEMARTVRNLDDGIFYNAYVSPGLFKVPECDNILAQKLMLEFNAPKFTEMACRS